MKRVLTGTIAAVMLAACGTGVPRAAAPVIGSVESQAAIRAGFAGLADRDMRRIFHSFDRNGDGFLSTTEADLPQATFDQLDTDHDKRLSEAEMTPKALSDGYAPAMNTFVKEAFQQIDTDGNGLISPLELAKAAVLGTLEADFHWSRNIRSDGWDLTTFTRELIQVLAAMPELQRPRAATSGKTPVLVVQGYLEPSYYFMYGIFRHLQNEGQPVYGINLFPNVQSADIQSKKVEAKIQEILKETGSSKINLVSHSFGGLITRQVIQKMGGSRYVDRYVSIATPHFGTGWCYMPGMGGACVDMQIGSAFLNDLNKQTTVAPVRYGAMYTKTDEITIPASNCILPGAKNYPPVAGTGHFLILWSPTTYKYVDECLK